jgi:hypothetical protein
VGEGGERLRWILTTQTNVLAEAVSIFDFRGLFARSVFLVIAITFLLAFGLYGVISMENPDRT